MALQMTPHARHPWMNPGTPTQTGGLKLLFVKLTLTLAHPHHYDNSVEENVEVIFVLISSSAMLDFLG